MHWWNASFSDEYNRVFTYVPQYIFLRAEDIESEREVVTCVWRVTIENDRVNRQTVSKTALDFENYIIDAQYRLREEDNHSGRFSRNLPR